MGQVFVCKDIEMKDGDVRIVHQNRTEIGVYRHAGRYYAYRMAKRNILGENARKLFKLDTMISPEKQARLKARSSAA